MSQVADPQQAFHRGTAAIFSLLTAEQMRLLANLPNDEELAVRVEDLAAKSNEGDLTDAEQAEYEAYIDANNLLAVLQSEARFRLAQSNS